MSTLEPPFSALRVTLKRMAAQDVVLFELRHPDGHDLPAFTAGAHLTVETPAGMRRNYSLCSDPSDLQTWQIAVKRDAQGRGGSIAMADQLAEGSLIKVSQPRNNFELDPRAKQVLFIAGGIGITPILSMMRHLKRTGAVAFRLIYCTRDADHSAFLPELQQEFPGLTTLHHDGGKLSRALDLWPEFETPRAAHVYCCGPKGLMDSVADMSGHWSSGSIHFESFGIDASTLPPNTSFAVTLKKSGAKVVVGATQSILEALRANGHRVASSCESGTCGTCRTTLMAGQADHRDMVLLDDEKAHQIMVCVSRAKSAELVLDL